MKTLVMNNKKVATAMMAMNPNNGSVVIAMVKKTMTLNTMDGRNGGGDDDTSNKWTD